MSNKDKVTHGLSQLFNGRALRTYFIIEADD